MTHSRKLGTSSVLIVLSVLALGLVGVGLAGGGHRAVTANVTVTLTDTKLTLSHGVVQAGPATFLVANKGRKLHALTISGPGLGGVQTRALKSGGSAKLRVTLRKGAYMLSYRAQRGALTVRWLIVSAATPATGSSRNVVPFPPPAPLDCD